MTLLQLASLMLPLLLLLLPVLALDDHACSFSWRTRECEPSGVCAFHFQFGDLTFDQSCRLAPGVADRLPQQRHLAFAGATAMTLSWTTFAAVQDAGVWLGTRADTLVRVPDDRVALETRSYYHDDVYSLYSHHATVSGLERHSTYYYQVGTENERSEVASFTTARESDDETPFRVAVVGDFGVDENANATLAFVTEQLACESVDFVLHVGDISYADDAFLKASELFGFFYEETYNRWMDALTPTMQCVPYMVSVGNHEAECHSPACFLSASKKDQLGNYSAYNARFKMPSHESGGVLNMWYSFDHGPLHIASISSETDYENAPKNSVTGRKYGGFGDQLTWLEKDLEKADANRGETPWLIVSMHRPVYTRSQVDDDGNPTQESKTTQKAFEELFIKYNVDVVVAGHVHLYERHLPIKYGKPVLDGVSADRRTYTNPKAPVYLINGAGGNTEGHEKVDLKKDIAWSVVVENKNYGLSLLDVTRNKLKWTFVATATDEVLDEFTIEKS